MPKISFVVAIYNVAQYIEQCVRSLYGQTLEDIEIILVDDCTPDDSIAIALRALDDYPNRKSQVKVVRHEVNQGLPGVRKNGIAAAHGEYIINFDGDDFADARMAELLYNKAAETGADLTICDYYRYSEDNCTQHSLVRNVLSERGDKVRDDIINRMVPPYLWCMLIHRSIFTNNEFVWPVRNMAENNVVSMQVAYYSKSVSHVNTPLYYYRNNPASITKNKTKERCIRNLKDFQANIEIYEQFLVQKNMEDKYSYGIFINKIRAKRCVIKFTNSRDCRQLWLRTFPEANKIFLFGNKYHKPSYREWVWFFTIILGLYPRFEKYLKKQFRLAKELM